MWQHPQCVLLSPTGVSITQNVYHSCSFVFIACFPSNSTFIKCNMSASTIHIKLNIISSALAWVCTLLDSGLSSFGVIHSFFVCLFIPLFVLDSLFVLLAFYLIPLPSDTNLCCSFWLCACCCISRYHSFFPFLWSPDSSFHIWCHTVCCWQDWTSNFSFFSPPITPSLCSIHCHPLSWSCHINTSAQPWQKPGNYGPLSLPLFVCIWFLVHFMTSIWPSVMLL